ncbi:sulfatase-like hydrolase/transferase [Halosimplex rubrum]|uniref:Sulfatase-like hydrolase/transferase n=1 Tax=Halosimplex rubrum TaxID=869889 RepID=A0A7D5PC13_9EURY|nr:sulfatase-like hydrolase/transferase [Halosimplex rubrum]QLH78919.1 sulfatase-like hydrolase/transferase [Halosimplex rubrum]
MTSPPLDGTAPSNVLLIVLDSVRARDAGLYGYQRETTPFLETFAERATVYEQARAPGIHSIASHASIWTGHEVEEHGLSRHEDELAAGTTVWEDLDDRGFETGLFTTNVVVSHASNLAAPFGTVVADEFTDPTEKLFESAHGPGDVRDHEGLAGNLSRCLDDDEPLKALANSVHHVYRKRRGGTGDSLDSTGVLDRFESWREDTDGPWAACLNLMDAHFPYEPDDRFDLWGDDRLREFQAALEKPPSYEYTHGRPWWQLETARHLYDGAVRQADARVERVVDGLDRAGALDDTLVVVTSDHGEGFGEHSALVPAARLVDHSWGIDEVLTHVPLVVSYPGRSDGERVERPVSLAEFPSVVEDVLAGTADPASFARDGPVVASTFRLLDRDAGTFDDSEADAADYRGPWRAVYDYDDGVVRKSARRGDSAAAFEVPDAQHVCPADGDAAARVASVFGELEDAGVKKGAGAVEAGVEDRLSDLGYLR